MELKKFYFVIAFGFILLSLFIITNSEAKPVPSPAGGGYVEFNSDDDFLSTIKPWLPEAELKTLTVEAWIYIEEYPKTNTYWSLFGQEGRFEVAIHSFANNLCASVYGENINSSTVSAKITVPLDKWVHVVAWYSPSANYGINGIGKPFPIGVGGMIFTSSKPFRIGGLIPINKEGPYLTGLNTFFKGYIDEVRISKVIRYNDKYEVPKERFTPDKDTLCLWYFDEEPTAHRHDDSSGNGWFLWKNEKGKLCALWGKLKNE